MLRLKPSNSHDNRPLLANYTERYYCVVWQSREHHFDPWFEDRIAAQLKV